MDAERHLELEEKIVSMLKTVYDPEVPVDIYSLGLIYKIDLNDEGEYVHSFLVGHCEDCQINYQ